MSEAYRPLTNDERAALQARTARACRKVWAFQDLPVQVAKPCPTCGGLFWLVTGKQEFAPSGYCLNCNPGILEHRPALLKLVAESMVDDIEDDGAIPTPDVHPF